MLKKRALEWLFPARALPVRMPLRLPRLRQPPSRHCCSIRCTRSGVTDGGKEVEREGGREGGRGGGEREMGEGGRWGREEGRGREMGGKREGERGEEVQDTQQV